MKKSLLLTILIALFIPYLVSASNLEDLKLKWTEENNYNGYTKNYLLEKDPNLFRFYLEESNYHYYNTSKIIERDNHYIVIDKYTITKYSRTDGIVKQLKYEDFQYVETDNYLYIMGDKNGRVVIEQYDYNLSLKNSYKIYNEYGYQMYLENDNLVVITQGYLDSEEYYLKCTLLSKDTLEKNNEHSLKVTGEYIHNLEKKIYTDRYANYYYLDSKYKINPLNTLENDDYFLYDNYNKRLLIYDKNGNIKKSVSTNYNNYTQKNCYFQIKDGYIYVGIEYYKYDSTTSKYNRIIVFSLYDYNLNLIKSTEVTLPQSNYTYSASLYGIYKNEKGIFTKYNVNDVEYYQIDTNLTFTESSSSLMYNSKLALPYENKKAPEESVQFQALNNAYQYLKSLENKKESELEDLYGENNVYLDFDFDSYYNEEKDEIIIGVIWKKEIYDNNNWKGYISSEIIALDESGASKNIIIDKEREIENYKEEYFYYNNITLNITDEYIIIGSSIDETSKVRFYDHEFNEVAEIISKTTSDYVIEDVIYQNGHMFVVYTYCEISMDVGLKDANISEPIEDTLVKLAQSGVFFDDIGVYGYGDSSIFEYYEGPFNIETKTDGNGTISTKKIKAESGEEIMFTITPKEGYILSEVKVIDANGNILTFTDNTFTMPSSNVTIEATFVPENPNTKDVAIVCCFIIIALGIFLTIRNIRKIKWLD